MKWRHGIVAVLLVLTALIGLGCGNKSVNPSPILTSGDFVVLAWNDLGMHCLNPTYDQAVILPPYNTVWAQVIKRGNPPQIQTADITVHYRILNNTYSYGKTDSHGAVFAQFWDNMQRLFGTTLPHDQGLNLVDPSLHNGLSGTMKVESDHFQVNGIPLVPVNDAGVWNPYQVAEIAVLNAAGDTLAKTRCTVPTSDEINCAKCHAQNGAGTASIGGGTADVFKNILSAHDALQQTTLAANAPVLCASCHASPVLGTPAPTHPKMYLSAAIHGFHATRNAQCYDCHPGGLTSCNRSIAHTADGGNCARCHGSLDQVSSSIKTGGRIPWMQEPKCSDTGCHTVTERVDTGTTLYRNATGHGGVYCAGCHGSPHAMMPSNQASDNYQAIQYQGGSRVSALGSCHACHGNSQGAGFGGFPYAHGPGGRKSACNICHTEVASSPPLAPHAFTWQRR